MAADLLGVRIKIDRAKKHLLELEREVAEFASSKAYALIPETDSNTGKDVVRVKIMNPIPANWSGTIGDIVHNLRTALDHLAVALVVRNGAISKTAIRETYFPVGASKKDFSTEKLQRASSAAIRLVERLKPYKGGNDAFWRLHQLDILDKHTTLIPVGASHKNVIFKIGMPIPGEPGMIWRSETLRVNNRQFPIQDGAVVLKIPPSMKGGKYKYDYQITFDVAFGEGQIVDGEPIVPTLKQFVDFIERVVNIFEQRIFR